MEVKKDYKNAIIHQVHITVIHDICMYLTPYLAGHCVQTLKSAIGMKESEESSGLASPKLLRYITRQHNNTVYMYILSMLHENMCA